MGIDKSNIVDYNLLTRDEAAERSIAKSITRMSRDVALRASVAQALLYLTDGFGHAVRKCTTYGKVVLTIGVPRTGTRIQRRSVQPLPLTRPHTARRYLGL